jgi:triacylglycerol esterase/lipase EstA (alpha/beta hydrolase family)
MGVRAALGRRRSTCGLALALLLVALWSPAPAQATPGTEDPPLRTAGGIARTLSCTSPFDDDREPVLLVPGLTADQNIDFGWNYRPELIARGFDVCSIDLPAEGFGDVTISGEYLVGAVRYLYEHAGGRRVDVLGHSFGGLPPRWLTRWFPETRSMVDDIVTLASPHHGTTYGYVGWLGCPACLQLWPSSDFLAALNRDDETPGDVDVTSLWTADDTRVLPQPAASALRGGGPHLTNLAIQQLCPGREVTHFAIVIDPVVHDLVLDALTRPGPADPNRIQVDCTALPFGAAPPGSSPTSARPERVTGEPELPWYTADLPVLADVPRTHWAWWEVQWAVHEGIADLGADRFAPRADWTRAEAATWLWHLAGSPPGAPATGFPDVPTDAPYHAALDWAVASGLAGGLPDGTFRPDGPITRAQLAMWVWAFAGRPPGAPRHGFVDVPAGAWYEDGLSWVAAQRLVAGYPGGRYRPGAFSSRAAVARMLFRLDTVT